MRRFDQPFVRLEVAERGRVFGAFSSLEEPPVVQLALLFGFRDLALVGGPSGVAMSRTDAAEAGAAAMRGTRSARDTTSAEYSFKAATSRPASVRLSGIDKA